MTLFLWWLVETTVFSAVVVPVVMIVCRWLRNRPAIQHGLWVVVLIKFVMPPLVAWPWSAHDLADVLENRLVALNVDSILLMD